MYSASSKGLIRVPRWYQYTHDLILSRYLVSICEYVVSRSRELGMAQARFERGYVYLAKAKFILFTNSITKVLGRFSVLYPWLSLDSWIAPLPHLADLAILGFRSIAATCLWRGIAARYLEYLLTKVGGPWTCGFPWIYAIMYMRISPPYTCLGHSVPWVPIAVSERSLGRVVSPDFTHDEVSHVN